MRVLHTISVKNKSWCSILCYAWKVTLCKKNLRHDFKDWIHRSITSPLLTFAFRIWAVLLWSSGSILHCVKSVRIRSYSSPYFLESGLITERYQVPVFIIIFFSPFVSYRYDPSERTFNCLVCRREYVIGRVSYIFLLTHPRSPWST